MSFKDAKESFVSGGTGSSIGTINAVTGVGLASYLLYSCLYHKFNSSFPSISSSVPTSTFTSTPTFSAVGRFLFEYATSVLPLLLALTIYSGEPWSFVGSLVGLAIASWAVPVVTGGMNSLKPVSLEIARERDEGLRRRRFLAADEDEDEDEIEVDEKDEEEERVDGKDTGQEYVLVEKLEDEIQDPPDMDTLKRAVKRATMDKPLGRSPRKKSSLKQNSNETKVKIEAVEPRSPTQSFLTVYRAHMMVITVLSILAVDFNIFPREFGKTELFGTSVMDVGVGSFVMSLGIISARPFLRPASSSTRPISIIPAVLTSIRKNAWTVVMGLVRVAMVKGAKYPEHVTEYGVHWNFFFTMGLVPPFGVLIYPLTRYLNFSAFGIILTLVHQALLSFYGLEQWAINSPRTNLLTMNKEGIVSFPGYLALYLLGLDLGQYILPPSARFAYSLRRPTSKTISKPGSLVPVLVGLSAVWWTLLWITMGCGVDGWGVQVSRRLANLPYVLWITAFNTTFLLGYLAIQLAFEPTTIESSREIVSNRGASVPLLLAAGNTNAQLVFLIANLLTGLTNLSINSLEMTNVQAVGILIAYSGAVYGIAWMLQGIQLKGFVRLHRLTNGPTAEHTLISIYLEISDTQATIHHHHSSTMHPIYLPKSKLSIPKSVLPSGICVTPHRGPSIPSGLSLADSIMKKQHVRSESLSSFLNQRPPNKSSPPSSDRTFYESRSSRTPLSRPRPSPPKTSVAPPGISQRSSDRLSSSSTSYQLIDPQSTITVFSQPFLSPSRASSGKKIDTPSTTFTLTCPSLGIDRKTFSARWVRDSDVSLYSVDASTRQKKHQSDEPDPTIRLIDEDSTKRPITVVNVSELKAMGETVAAELGPCLKFRWEGTGLRKNSQSAKALARRMVGANIYSLIPLVFLSRTKEEAPLVPKSIPWVASDLKDLQTLWTSYEDFKFTPRALHTVLRQLATHGIAFIRDVPTDQTENDTCELRALANRIGELRHTFYGQTWDVRSLGDRGRNVAYTDVPLGLHMDLLYFQNPPQLQFLHSLRARAKGGASYFVDSFRAAEDLRQRKPDVFRKLTMAKREIKHVNYSPPFQAPFPPDPNSSEVAMDALKAFAKELRDPKLVFELTLKEGECVVFDNRRVLHARRGFKEIEDSGLRDGPQRWLKGCYVDGDAAWDRLRVLEGEKRRGEW
ncbi:Uncharacterized membrane protein [Phaffia rhodozyma]|uniref:GPI-anchored wall transfer protein 1 n=1 Tax=Phaffia rhodozyma TaxID=264483 RepID=A0A0F7SL17_PHARH|nr:Uncharacterized membrane protein [Phaffia rhodozyma]